jgi:hypothetical protein
MRVGRTPQYRDSLPTAWRVAAEFQFGMTAIVAVVALTRREYSAAGLFFGFWLLWPLFFSYRVPTKLGWWTAVVGVNAMSLLILITLIGCSVSSC